MLNGVIFDLDGTLGDSLPVCFAAFRGVFREYLGAEYRDDEIRAMFGPTEEGILRDHLPADGEEPLARYLALYRASHHLAPQPFDGIEEILDRLDAAGVHSAVVTGKGPHSAAISLDEWGMSDRFTHVAAGGEDGNIKDRNMQRIIDEWAVEPASVVSVGDAPSDVHAARTVGLVPVGAAWASTTNRSVIEDAAPDVIFEDVASFAAWLFSRREGP